VGLVVGLGALVAGIVYCMAGTSHLRQRVDHFRVCFPFNLFFHFDIIFFKGRGAYLIDRGSALPRHFILAVISRLRFRVIIPGYPSREAEERIIYLRKRHFVYQ